MKTTIAFALAVLTFGSRQAVRLHQLRDEVAQLSSIRYQADSGPAEESAATDQHKPAIVPVTPSELKELAMIVHFAGEDFMKSNWFQFHDGEGITYPPACDTLARLNTDQLREILDSWPTEGRSDKDRQTDIHRFMLSVGKVNPAATLPLMYELSQDSASRVSGSISQTFQFWFRKDPQALLDWIEQQGIPPDFGGEGAIWADAARALTDLSVERLRALTSHEVNWSSSWAYRELAAKLEQEQRLTFFTNLHAATDGKSDHLATFLAGFIYRVPFAQVANLADKVPPFKPVNEVKRSNIDPDPGSLRYEVALSARDSTAAERWAWLTKVEADRPSGRAHSELVKRWCKNDYLDTAKWVRDLSPGEERQEAIASVISFLQASGAKQLANDWKTM
jgi:hypothetical protein